MANWFMNRLVIRREIDMLVPESYEFDVRSTWHTILDQCFSSAGYCGKGWGSELARTSSDPRTPSSLRSEECLKLGSGNGTYFWPHNANDTFSWSSSARRSSTRDQLRNGEKLTSNWMDIWPQFPAPDLPGKGSCLWDCRCWKDYTYTTNRPCPYFQPGYSYKLHIILKMPTALAICGTSMEAMVALERGETCMGPW